MPPFVELHAVRKKYPGAVALDGLTLDVAEGEFLTVLGPSGSGKTTLLRIIAGLESADSGVVRIAGRDAANLPPHRRDVAWVPQRPALYPHKDVEGNLLAGLDLRRAGWWPFIRRSSAERQLAAETAELLGLSGVLRRRPDELSGGEQQRVALGRAVVRGAALWLLDEPLAHLDARRRRQFRSELPLLHGRLGVTILYVTHDPAEALGMGSRLAVFDAGRVLQVGPPADVWRAPAHRSVAELLADGPLNCLPGLLFAAEGGWQFRPADSHGWPTVPHDGGPPLLPGGGTAGRAVVAVVRPRDVTLCPHGTLPEGGMAGRLNIGAGIAGPAPLPAGDGWFVGVECGQVAWQAHWPADRPPVAGQKGDVFLKPGRIHWFDGRTGDRLAND